MYPAEWILAASTPLVLWLLLFLASYLRSSHSLLTARANLLAIAGAVMAFVSFLTGWYVIESGGDWALLSDYALFLLFTYPFAVVTPLAGIGQAGILLWVFGYARGHTASIEPFYGYAIGWVSVFLMMASIVWPVGIPRYPSRPDVYDRLFTISFKRSSRHRMSSEYAFAYLLAIVLIASGVTYFVFTKRIGGYILIFIGLFFLGFMMRRALLERRRIQNLRGQEH